MRKTLAFCFALILAIFLAGGSGIGFLTAEASSAVPGRVNRQYLFDSLLRLDPFADTSGFSITATKNGQPFELPIHTIPADARENYWPFCDKNEWAQDRYGFFKDKAGRKVESVSFSFDAPDALKSGAMFGSLRNYENSVFYHNDPFIAFDTMYETGRYVIFAAGCVSTEEWGRNYVDFYALRSANIPERQAAIDTLLAASVHTCTVDVQPEDQLLVLVTCVEKDEERRVVAARRIRDGEDEAALKKLVEKSRKR